MKYEQIGPFKPWAVKALVKLGIFGDWALTIALGLAVAVSVIKFIAAIATAQYVEAVTSFALLLLLLVAARGMCAPHRKS